MEIWKDIEGYEGLYQISDKGRVKSLPKKVGMKLRGEKILKSNMGNSYCHVVLCKNKKKKTISIHRLVAKAFIPNIKNARTVNHKDENKTNNNVDNLEWMTHKENINYGTRSKRSSETKKGVTFTKKHREKLKVLHEIPVLQLSLDGKFIKVWSSAKEASRKLSISYSGANKCCNGKLNSAGGYKWQYLKD